MLLCLSFEPLRTMLLFCKPLKLLSSAVPSSKAIRFRFRPGFELLPRMPSSMPILCRLLLEPLRVIHVSSRNIRLRLLVEALHVRARVRMSGERGVCAYMPIGGHAECTVRTCASCSCRRGTCD